MFKTTSEGVAITAAQPGDALASLGGQTVHPPIPLYKTPLPPPVPETPHFVALFAKDRGLFPRCHGDAAQEKCKRGGREGSDGGGHVQPSVLESACLKTSQGRDEKERKEGGAGNCADIAPRGAWCERVKRMETVDTRRVRGLKHSA
ncbi:hypothetical protein GOODEAATRI_016719 [Goodea atripinnis]|uniref:Uncharacterized protein n=1 Tax=Goodea atripinnis TaxID=208336 RepID=A0ABV0PYK0_9TELE